MPIPSRTISLNTVATLSGVSSGPSTRNNAGAPTFTPISSVRQLRSSTAAHKQQDFLARVEEAERRDGGAAYPVAAAPAPAESTPEPNNTLAAAAPAPAAAASAAAAAAAARPPRVRKLVHRHHDETGGAARAAAPSTSVLAASQHEVAVTPRNATLPGGGPAMMGRAGGRLTHPSSVSSGRGMQHPGSHPSRTFMPPSSNRNGTNPGGRAGTPRPKAGTPRPGNKSGRGNTPRLSPHAASAMTHHHLHVAGRGGGALALPGSGPAPLEHARFDHLSLAPVLEPEHAPAPASSVSVRGGGAASVRGGAAPPELPSRPPPSPPPAAAAQQPSAARQLRGGGRGRLPGSREQGPPSTRAAGRISARAAAPGVAPPAWSARASAPAPA